MLKVNSEIGKMKKVLVHPPGRELLNLTPSTLGELLFDDIPYLRKAREEHAFFRELLRGEDVEVVLLEDLMVETLEQNPGLKEEFLKQYLTEGSVNTDYYRRVLLDYYLGFQDLKEMVLKTMEGISNKDIQICKTNCLVDAVHRDTQMIINPMPNLYFTRDPFSTIGEGASINRMHSVTRGRETIYSDYILKYHKDYKDKLDIYYQKDDLFSIEGGDIFNFSEGILGIGISQRTTPEAIQDLALRLFYDFDTPIKKIIAFNIPSLRAFMHLDTVFTQIDYNAFLYHPGIMGSLRVYIISKGFGKRDLKIHEETGNLEEILSRNLGLDKVKLYPCAGGDYITSQREQWNDGSNTLAVAPRTLIVYDRNETTNEMLREDGYTLLEMPSSELSRGRGGPRCMSMPLFREDP